MAAGQPSRSDVTAADDKVIGFEYQYYYFLYCLLNLDEGQAVGLEVKDDVHVDLTSGTTILAQLKHTIDPEHANLTELDPDFWKTLYNWVLLIQEAGRGVTSANAPAAEAAYCRATHFVLVTNKSVGPRNELVGKLAALKAGTSPVSDVKAYIQQLGAKSKDDKLKVYIQTVAALPDSTLAAFLLQLEIETGFDDLLEKIKKRLHKMMITHSRIDSVLKVLDGALRQASYETVKNRGKVVLTYEEFHRKYALYFEIGRSEELLVEEYGCEIDNPIEQLFIQQLLDIEDIYEGEFDEVLRYTGHKFTAFNNLMRWLQNGQITEVHLQQFQTDAITRWKNAFKEAHREARRRNQTSSGAAGDAVPADLLTMAQSCLDEVRRFELSIRNQQLGIELSNGQFYHLADMKKIGWLIDWQTKYGTDK